MYKHGGGAAFDWKGPDNPEGVGTTAWSLFAADTDHFAPSSAPELSIPGAGCAPELGAIRFPDESLAQR